MFHFARNDMLLHSHRLRSKDVRFLTKKRQYFGWWMFGFFYVKQYPNVKNNQFSFHVSIKLSKKSTVRNKIKRLIMNYLRDTNAVKLAFWEDFYKVFIILNKNKILDSGFKTLDVDWQKEFQGAFNLLSKILWPKKL